MPPEVQVFVDHVGQKVFGELCPPAVRSNALAGIAGDDDEAGMVVPGIDLKRLEEALMDDLVLFSRCDHRSHAINSFSCC
jgi:hypothetical protein